MTLTHPNSDDVKVLRRVSLDDFHVFTAATSDEPIGLVAIVDTETTGLDCVTDSIIELSVAVCEYCKSSGTIYRVIRRFNGYEQPKQSIPKEITELTGIDDKMVLGSFFSDEEIQAAFKDVNLIVCYNASFDAKFLYKRFAWIQRFRFACAWTDVNWKASLKVTHTPLELIAMKLGYFFDGHRARNDVDALISVLSERTTGGNNYFLELLVNARQKKSLVRAIGMPFDLKHHLKARGYRWDPVERSWYIITTNPEAEILALKELGCPLPSVRELSLLERFTIS